MFKNDFAVVRRSFPVTKSGDHELKVIPQASLDTLWFAGMDGVHIQSVTNTGDDKRVERPFGGIAELLHRNVGQWLRLSLNAEDAIVGKTVAGRVVSVGGRSVLLDDGKRTIALLLTHVSTITGDRKALQTMAEDVWTERILRFRGPD